MEDSQLLKGILEGCVLGVIARGETYGYAILAELEQAGFPDVGEGTLYPVLTRLHQGGYLSCRRAKSPLGPIRKYYAITEAGQLRLAAFQQSYRRVTFSANRILFSAAQEEEHVYENQLSHGQGQATGGLSTGLPAGGAVRLCAESGRKHE
jgi:PadR family transcriptional regulator PadR